MNNTKYSELANKADNALLAKNLREAAVFDNTKTAAMFISTHKYFIYDLLKDERIIHRYNLLMEYFEDEIGVVDREALTWPLAKIGIYNMKYVSPISYFTITFLYVFMCYMLAYNNDASIVYVLIIFAPVWFILLLLTLMLLTSKMALWRNR